MISSPPALHPLIVCPMEGEAEVPVHVCTRLQCTSQPCPHSLPSVTCRNIYDVRRGKERTGRMLVTKEHGGEIGENVRRKSRRTSCEKRERSVRTERCSGAETGSEITKHKTRRGLRGTGKLTLLPSQSVMERASDLQPSQSASETGLHLQTNQSGMETGPDPQTNKSAMESRPDLQPTQLVIKPAEPPDSPPAMKGWVIGPFLQSFKSKMASFTEIVMSPVRLFKPSCPSTPPNTFVDLQTLCPDDVSGSDAESHSEHSSEGSGGESVDVQRQSQTPSKSEGSTDSGSLRAEGRTHAGPEVGERSVDLQRPETSSAPAWSSSTRRVIPEHPSVRKLVFDTEAIVGGVSFEEEERLHAENRLSGGSPTTQGLRDCAAFPSSQRESLRESPRSGKSRPLSRTKLPLALDPFVSLICLDSSPPYSPKTRRRSHLSSRTSEEHRAGKRAQLGQSCSKGPTPSKPSPGRPLKRSPSSDLFTDTSPKKAPSSDEASACCEETCTTEGTPQWSALEENGSGSSSALSTSVYFTPPVSFEATPGGFRQLGADEDGSPLTVVLQHTEMEDCGVPLSPSRTPSTPAHPPGQDSVWALPDNLDCTPEGDGEPGSQDLVQIPPQTLESALAPPPARGSCDDQNRGGGAMFSGESQTDPQACLERSSVTRERIKGVRGRKREKGMRKQRSDDVKEKVLLMVTGGEAGEGVESEQNSSISIGTCVPLLVDTDLHRSLSFKRVIGQNSRGSCLTAVKGRGGRRNNLKVERPSVTEITPTMVGSSLEFKDCGAPDRSADCGVPPTGAKSPGKKGANFQTRKLRSSAIALENIRHSPNQSVCNSTTVTSEPGNKEEDPAGVNESDTLPEGARPMCLTREHRPYRRRKRELSPGVDMDPMPNGKSLAVQEGIQGDINRATASSEGPKESEPSARKHRNRADNGLHQKEMTVDTVLEREAALSGKSSPCNLELQEGPTTGAVSIQAGGSSPGHADDRSQARPRVCKLTRVDRKRGGGREKGKEGATEHMFPSSPATDPEPNLPEADDKVESKFVEVPGLIDEEVPKGRRGKKSKQRDGLRRAGSKGRSFFRGRREPEEDLADEGEKPQEAGSLECDPLPSRLLRSYSCPEIPSLLKDVPWTAPPTPSVPQSRHRPSSLRHCLPVPLPPSSPKRIRRHTVCSLEVEREIAPLCLRKEVYPAFWGRQHHNPTSPLSSTSFAALASCFLSSPLAFLSRKPEGRRSSSGTSSSSACSCDVTLSSSSDTIPSTSSLVSSPVRHLLPDSTSCAPPRSSQSTASVSPFCSVSSQIPVSCEIESKQEQQQLQEEQQQQEEDEEEEEETTTCSTAEHETAEPRHEKSSPGSVIKAGSAKPAEPGMVSRFRIRRTPPKPPANLTPMGLPRPVRPKKKDFSLEEIYTNKNFHTPPEGRLETIFEVPTSNCDGSLSLTGSRRFKRLVKFPELGVSRKPRKPSAAAGKGAFRKTGLGRTRRRGTSKAKDGHSHNTEELDSLLCSKLDQLDAWIALDGVAP